VHIQMTGDQAQPTKVVRNRGPRLLFLPIISAEDGYGATYGALVARPSVAGANSRLAFPLTWGGEKKAGIEFEKRMLHAPIDRVTSGAAITRRTNPLFEQDDDRQRIWARAEREIVRSLRVGATAGWQHVSFATADEHFADAGADVIFDTRVDPGLPRNAVYAKAMWEMTGPNTTGHYVLDARGYLGLFHQNVLAVRALRDASSGPLPLYLKPLLGGMDNLRGFKAGTAAGDNLMATSAELIVPLTSPMDIGKIGVSAFVDAGTVYDRGERFADQTLKQGVGGSVWFAAAFIHFNVAVAHGRGSSTRVHAGGSITF
jgi:outer membrane protein assembly factor BamA